ncbi:MAG TPA: outer membrane protein assembly factor BamA [Devosiaceae bacterium]|nr:outer membrane protein assembly factor BamA [Devosiaceae bacterium]
MNDRYKLMRSVILALALLLAAPLMGITPMIGASAAQAAVVSKISVSGNHTVDSQTIMAIIPVKVGQASSPDLLSASTAALYKTGFFKSATVTQSGSIVFVKVVENPTVAAVLFQGNQRFSDAELLTMVSVSSRSGYSPDRVQTDIASIKAAYTQAGYTNVSVTAKTESVGGGRTRITFVINEGTRSGIAAINFTGNHAFNSGTLKGVIRTHETGWLSWLLHDDSYDEQQLEIDKQLIRMYYANHGYPDAQVTAAVAQYDASRNGYFITYSIQEGDHYTFGPMAVETSIPNLQTDSLRDTIRTNTGGSYSQAELQKTASDMAFAATSQGYPFADVRPRVDRDLVNHRLDITYLVDNGPRVYVERINITGNLKTRDFVIRRELDFSEGDPFNQALLARDREHIMGLGFFKSVDITTEPGSAPDKVIIDIAVVEQSTGDYGITAGYSTQDGILGEVSLTERNFLGRGQYVRAAVGASGSGKTFDFSFTEPRFMGLKISTGFDVYDHIASQTQTSYYGLTTIGGQVRAGMPITDALSGNVFLGAEQKSYATSGNCFDSSGNSVACTDPTSTGSTWPTSQVVMDGTVFHKAFVGYNLNYTTLDDPKHPTSGIYAILSQQYDGWDYNYLKTEVKGRYFMPLADTGIVASVRSQAGIINNFSGGNISALEAFHPGASLLRSFQSYGPTLLPNNNCTAYAGSNCGLTQGEQLGAVAYAGISGELKSPIPMLPESYGLSAAVWGDAAWISDAEPAHFAGNLDPGSVGVPIRASVGGSLIWDSPFGPLRADVGYPVLKAPSDIPQVFQISLQSLL